MLRNTTPPPLPGAAASVVVPSTPAIAGLQDEMILMTSLQRPKKITFLGRWVFTLRDFLDGASDWRARNHKAHDLL